MKIYLSLLYFIFYAQGRPVTQICETSSFCAELGGVCSSFDDCPVYDHPPCHPEKPDIDCVCCPPNGTFAPTPRPTRSPTPRPTPWPTTAFPTPRPTAVPTPSPTPSIEECEPEKLDIVQVINCSMVEGMVLGTYVFEVKVVLAEELAFIVDFDNYFSGSIRSRGSCDNRPNDTLTDFADLFDEVAYPLSNGWTKTVIPDGYQSTTNVSVFYDVVEYSITLDLEDLAEECTDIAGGSIVDVVETPLQKTYSGSMYVHGIELVTENPEEESTKFTKECAFDISWKGKKGTTKRDFDVKDAELEVQWTHSECVDGEALFVLETRVTDELSAVLENPVSGQFAVVEITTPAPGACAAASEAGVCLQVWELSSLSQTSTLGFVEWTMQNSQLPLVIELNMNDANPCRDMVAIVQYRHRYKAVVKRIDPPSAPEHYQHKQIKASAGACDQYYLRTTRIDECSCEVGLDPTEECYTDAANWTAIADFRDPDSIFSSQSLLKTAVRCPAVEMWSWKSESKNGLILLEYCLYDSNDRVSLLRCSRLLSPLFH